MPNHEQQRVRDFVDMLRLPLGARVTAIDRGQDFDLRFSSTIRHEDREQLRRFTRDES